VIDLRYTTIDAWPGEPTPAYRRKRGAFKASFTKILDDLERELGHLKAKDITVQAYLKREDIRNDGWPRSSARPSQPGIILSLGQTKAGPLRFACDTYLDWEDNIRAIGLTLESLRAVERYGAVQKAEQYRGWSALPPAGGAVTPPMNVEQACRWLAAVTGMVFDQRATPETYRDVYRTAARKCHPDTGGNQAKFVELQDVARVLDKHFGRTA
jgi:hypothetical protein